LHRPDPAGEVATSIYRIAQELMTNVARHAMAQSVSVRLREVGQSLGLVVQDDGVGITHRQASSPNSIGLIGIRERVNDLRGRFSIIRTKGGGTCARVNIPLRRKEPSG
jgi:two-component system NarL family sensor kinase